MQDHEGGNSVIRRTRADRSLLDRGARAVGLFVAGCGGGVTSVGCSLGREHDDGEHDARGSRLPAGSPRPRRLQ